MFQVPQPRAGKYSDCTSNQPTMVPNFQYEKCMFGQRSCWINLSQIEYEAFKKFISAMSLLMASTVRRNSIFPAKCVFDRSDGYEVRPDQMIAVTGTLRGHSTQFVRLHGPEKSIASPELPRPTSGAGAKADMPDCPERCPVSAITGRLDAGQSIWRLCCVWPSQRRTTLQNPGHKQIVPAIANFIMPNDRLACAFPVPKRFIKPDRTPVLGENIEARFRETFGLCSLFRLGHQAFANAGASKLSVDRHCHDVIAPLGVHMLERLIQIQAIAGHKRVGRTISHGIHWKRVYRTQHPPFILGNRAVRESRGHVRTGEQMLDNQTGAAPRDDTLINSLRQAARRFQEGVGQMRDVSDLCGSY